MTSLICVHLATLAQASLMTSPICVLLATLAQARPMTSLVCVLLATLARTATHLGVDDLLRLLLEILSRQHLVIISAWILVCVVCNISAMISHVLYSLQVDL